MRFSYRELTILSLTSIVPHAASGSIFPGPSFHGRSDFLPLKTSLNRFVPRGSGLRMCGSSQVNSQAYHSEPMSLDISRSVPNQKAF